MDKYTFGQLIALSGEVGVFGLIIWLSVTFAQILFLIIFPLMYLMLFTAIEFDLMRDKSPKVKRIKVNKEAELWKARAIERRREIVRLDNLLDEIDSELKKSVVKR